MTVAVGVALVAGGGVAAGAGGGLEIEPLAARAASGLQPAISPEAAGAASFQSNWQSMLASLSAEMNGFNAQKAQSSAEQTASATATPKSTQQPVPSDAEVNTAQASFARFRLDQGALLPRETNTAAAASSDTDASLGASRGTSLESPENSGKSVKRESGAQQDEEKKPDATSAVSGQAASQTPIHIAVPMPVALPQPPQRANATAAQHAQSFLTDASHAAELRTAVGPPNSMTPAMAAAKTAAIGIAAPTEPPGSSPGSSLDSSLGASIDTNAAGIVPSQVAGGGQHGLTAHARPADLRSSTAAAAQVGLAPAANIPAANGAANTDTIDSDSITGAASASMGAPFAAHASTTAAADKRIVEQAAGGAAHGAGDAASTAPQGHAPAVQPVAAAGDSSAFARDPAAGHADANTPPGSTGSAGADAGARETFAALDADAAHGATWLHAGAHSAEAGFEDPALGWVSVRADLAGGGVHASVVPGTAEAAQALGAHMAGLKSYLSEQRTPVHTLTLAAPDGDAGSQQGTGQGSGQNAAYRDASGQQPAAPPVLRGSQVFVQTASAAGDASHIVGRAGTSISLIA